jgi:hypothetical protein
VIGAAPARLPAAPARAGVAAWRTLRVGVLRDLFLAIAVGLLGTGVAITLAIAFVVPQPHAPAGSGFTGLLVIVAILLCFAAGAAGALWVRLRRSERMHLVPGAPRVVRGAMNRFHALSFAVVLAAVAMAYLLGMDARACAAWAAAYSLVGAGAELFMQLLPRQGWRRAFAFLVAFVLLALPFFFLLAVAFGVLPPPWAVATAVPAWPLAALWMQAPGLRPWPAPGARPAPGWTERLDDRAMRLHFRPSRYAAARAGARPDPSLLMRAPHLRSSLWLNVLIGAGMAPMTFWVSGDPGSRNWASEFARDTMLAVVATTVLPYVSGFERLALLPGGLSRETLPAALRGLLWRMRLPLVLSLSITGVLWAAFAASFAGAHGAASTFRPWNSLAIIGMILAYMALGVELLCCHPAIVRRQWIAFLAFYSIYGLYIVVSRVVFPDHALASVGEGFVLTPAEAGALAWTGVTLLVATLVCALARRLGRHAWRRADLALLVAHWRRQRELHASLQETA